MGEDGAISPDGAVIALAIGREAHIIACDICTPTSGLVMLANQRVTRGFTADERVTYLP